MIFSPPWIFKKAYDFALLLDVNFTVVTKEIAIPFHFGKVVWEKNYITGVQEKPEFRHEILSGIYFLKPDILSIIPSDTYYGIDMLIKDMLSNHMKIGRYPMKEYWLDIGQLTDFHAAQDVYNKHFYKIKQDK